MMFGSFIIFIIFLILLFGGTFAYIFFYDMAWDRSIAKVGKYKIKHEGGFFVAYVYNYFHDYDCFMIMRELLPCKNTTNYRKQKTH